ncbi:MAG: hypothetical protein ACI85I_002039, partial [Arenicella sp.]
PWGKKRHARFNYPFSTDRCIYLLNPRLFF